MPCKLSVALRRSFRRMAVRREFLIPLEVVHRNFLGKSSVEIARCETCVFVGGVSRVAEFRPWRWARATILFASGRAWRSEFRDLRHLSARTRIPELSTAFLTCCNARSIIFVVPERHWLPKRRFRTVGVANHGNPHRALGEDQSFKCFSPSVALTILKFATPLARAYGGLRNFDSRLEGCGEL